MKKVRDLVYLSTDIFIILTNSLDGVATVCCHFTLKKWYHASTQDLLLRVSLLQSTAR